MSLYLNSQHHLTKNNVPIPPQLFAIDFPVCKFTTVTGTLSMFMVNGVTWLRMYKAYKRNYADKPKQKGKIGPWTYDKERSAAPVTASFLVRVSCVVVVTPSILS